MSKHILLHRPGTSTTIMHSRSIWGLTRLLGCFRRLFRLSFRIRKAGRSKEKSRREPSAIRVLFGKEWARVATAGRAAAAPGRNNHGAGARSWLAPTATLIAGGAGRERERESLGTESFFFCDFWVENHGIPSGHATMLVG